MPKLSFGQKLMLLRKNKKLSQKEFADRLHIGIANIARYETNARLPHAKTIVAISDFFKVPTDYLLKEDEDIVSMDDPELFSLASQIDKLSAQEKNKLKNLIKSYLADNQP